MLIEVRYKDDYLDNRDYQGGDYHDYRDYHPSGRTISLNAACQAAKTQLLTLAA